MVYEKQTWVDGSAGGTPINAARLGHIEDGIEAASTEIPSHNHAIADVVDLQEALDAKAEVISDIPGLQVALDSKAEEIADLPGLQTELDSKVETTTVVDLNVGTVLPAAGQAGRLFVLIP